MDDVERGQVVDRIVDQARAVRAAQLVVEDASGHETRVALSPRGRKQLPLRRVLTSIDWQKVTMVDSSGGVLDVLIAEREPAVDADAPPAPPAQLPQSREAELMIVMTAAQAQVLDRVVALIKPIMEGYQGMASVLSARLEHAESRNAEALEVQAQMQAEAASKVDADEQGALERMVGDVVGRYVTGLAGAHQLPAAAPPAKPGNGG